MAFTSNIRAFRNLDQPDALVNSYRLLIAVELALKDGSCMVQGGGHDVPGMLQVAANLSTATTYVSAQLNALSQNLRNDLGSITCQGKNGAPNPVRPASYPDLRYGRQAGDWGGLCETPTSCFASLELTCLNLCAFLSAHGAHLGVHL